MIPTAAVEDVFRDAFEDVALLIGGAASAWRLEDDFVWALFRRLDRVRVRALSRLSQSFGSAPLVSAADRPQPAHPAVEQFLLRNRRSRDATAAGGAPVTSRMEAHACRG